MKNVYRYFAGVSLILLPLIASAQAPSNTIGRILLDVEKSGEAWYVLPDSSERVYLPDGNAAYDSMRTYGLGVTNADLMKIPVALAFDNDIDSDSDGLGDKLEEALGTDPNDNDMDNDGFNDGIEVTTGHDPNGLGRLSYDEGLANRLKGKILLQVENLGQAWYVNPTNGKRYYMKDGVAAYTIMRALGLGASSAIISDIPQVTESIDCGESLECFIRAVENDQPADVLWMNDAELFGIFGRSTKRLAMRKDADSNWFSDRTLSLDYYYPDNVREELVESGEATEQEIDDMLAQVNASTPLYTSIFNECSYGPGSDIIDVLRRWQEGSFNVAVSISLGGGESELGGDYEEIGHCLQKGAKPLYAPPEGCTVSESGEGETVIDCTQE